jgi:hypothetical protein
MSNLMSASTKLTAVVAAFALTNPLILDDPESAGKSMASA